jgi:hypothetical protein
MISAAFCLMSLTLISTMDIGHGETLNIGPARISLDLDDMGSYIVQNEETSSFNHRSDARNSEFRYEIYPTSIVSQSAAHQVMIEIHQMSTSQPLEQPISPKDASTGIEHCIAQSAMMPGRTAIQTKPYTIDGRQGILATAGDDQGNPLYIAAYSPDERDGSGTIVCIVGSNLPWEITRSIFDSVKTELM